MGKRKIAPMRNIVTVDVSKMLTPPENDPFDAIFRARWKRYKRPFGQFTSVVEMLDAFAKMYCGYPEDDCFGG